MTFAAALRLRARGGCVRKGLARDLRRGFVRPRLELLEDRLALSTMTSSQVSFELGKGVYFTASGDFNGDGIADLASVNSLSGNVAFVLGTRQGTLQLPVRVPI